MTSRLEELLAQRSWLLADGAMGTNLFARGLPVGTAPERWNLDQPEQITELHQEFLAAGVDIILSNSFGGSRRRLGLMEETEVVTINRQAAEIAVAARDSSGRNAVVAGSMGPTGALLEPYGPLSFSDAEAMYREQADALAEGGVDCLWIETMAAVEEMQAAVAGAAAVDLPLVCTFSFDSQEHTMMGVDVEQIVTVLRELVPKPLAFGSNCGGEAANLIRRIEEWRALAGEDVILVAKANCGKPRYHHGQFEYGKPVQYMADYAQLARDAGARIIGGCCGTTAKHLNAMRTALEDYQPQPLREARLRILEQTPTA